MIEKYNKRIVFVLLGSILLTLLIFGSLLRFQKLDAWGFWIDEHLTHDRGQYSWGKVFVNKKTVNNFMFYSINALNNRRVNADVLNESQLRFPMALAGVLGILAIFLAVRKMSGNIPGLIAAAITCFSYYHIYYSREARYYSFFFLAAVWIIHATWNCINSKSSRFPWKSYLMYSIAAAFGLGIHQGCYFLVAITNTYLMIWECLRGIQYLRQRTMKFSHMFVRLIVVLCFLVLPLLTCWPTIVNSFNKVSNSIETTSTLSSHGKLIENLNLKTFVDLQADYWKELISKKHIIYIVFIPFLLLFKKRYWHILLLYILLFSVPLITLSLTDKSLFDTFRSKYIIFIFVMSVISVSVAIGLIVNFFLNLVKYKKWNAIVKLIILSLITLLCVYGLIDFYNKKLKTPSYAQFYHEKGKSIEKLYAFLGSNMASNSILIVSEYPRKPGGTGLHADVYWQNYWAKRSGIILTNKIYRPKTLRNKLRGKVFWPPRDIWYILTCGQSGLTDKYINQNYFIHKFKRSKNILVHPMKPCFSKYELIRNTIKLFKAYSAKRRPGDRREAYLKAATNLEKWLKKQKPYSSNVVMLVEAYKQKFYKKNKSYPAISLADIFSLNVKNAYSYAIYANASEHNFSKYNSIIKIVPPRKKEPAIISFINKSEYNVLEFEAFLPVQNKWPYDVVEVYGDNHLLKQPVKIKTQKAPQLLRYNIAGRTDIKIKVKSGRLGYYEEFILANPVIKYEPITWCDFPSIEYTNFYSKSIQKNANTLKKELCVVPMGNGTAGSILIPLNKHYDQLSIQIRVESPNKWPYEVITIYGDDKVIGGIDRINVNDSILPLIINTKGVGKLRIEIKPGRKAYYEKVILFDSKFEPSELKK